MTGSSENPLTETDFKEIGKKAGKDPGLQLIRNTAWERLLSTPFPTATHELWRYTKPELFDFACLRDSSPVEVDIDSAGIEFGRMIPEQIASEIINQGSNDIAGDATHFLQMAAAVSGCFLHLRKNAQCEAPVYLKQIVKSSRCGAPLIVVLLEEGASMTLVEDLHEQEDIFYAPRIEILLRSNSNFRFYSVNRLPFSSTYLGRHRIYAARDVNADIMHVITGGKVSRLDLDARMYGPGSTIRLSSVYIADEKRHVDIHTVQDHIAADCQSNLLSKGVLKDKGRSVYYGFIRVAEKAQHTDAYQTNRNLVFSKEARADSIPNLEIKANDVKCSHGATVGQVSEDELFYLMTRGLRRPDAERLLIEGFMDEVITRIGNEPLLELVRSTVMERVSHGSSRS